MRPLFKTLELDDFDLLWKDLIEQNSHFAAITQRVTHPVDIYETNTGITFEVAAVGLNKKEIDILVEGEQLRIKYEKEDTESRPSIYKGIKRSSFDLSWKISSKFDLNKLTASLDKGLLIINIPTAEGKAIRKIELS
jgi:HSP20 family molecular chaperone IbpA